MRITFNMMTGNVLDNLMASSERLIDAQNRASSGKRIHTPSDDVTGASRAMRLRSSLSEIQQFQRNSDSVESNLVITASVLSNIINTLQEVRGLALSSGTADEARISIASQVEQAMESIAAIANTHTGEKYILSGSQTQTMPFIENPGEDPPFIYQGDDVKFMVQIAPGTYATANICGDVVMNMGGSAVPTSPDIFNTLHFLQQEILSGDIDAISARVEDIDANLSNVTALRSQVGARLSRLDSIGDTLMDTRLSLTELLSKTEDADLAEAMVDLHTRQNVYQAAISTASRILNMSLADYIK